MKDELDKKIDETLESMKNKIKKEKLSDEFKAKLVKIMEEEYNKNENNKKNKE